MITVVLDWILGILIVGSQAGAFVLQIAVQHIPIWMAVILGGVVGLLWQRRQVTH